MDSEESKQARGKASKPSQTRRKKAPRACVRCRKRKTRCDVSFGCMPCSNCRMKGWDCEVMGSEPLAGACRNRKQHDAGRGVSEQPSREPSPPPQTVAGIYHTPVSQGTPDDLSSNTTSSPSIDSERPCSVHYTSYDFLEVSNRANLQVEGVTYLASQGCFNLPSRPALNIIIQQYFRLIHPLFPLLNEVEFCEIVQGGVVPSPSAPKISLLLLQSFLFASCDSTPLEAIQSMGFADCRQARSCFYRKAKLLYDFDTETSSLILSQAALLLSRGSLSLTLMAGQMDSVWLAIAINHAEIMGANQCESSLSMNRSNENTLKRLWWCCIIQDRLASLCLGRRSQIDSTRFDANSHWSLGTADLKDEIHHSQVFSSSLKTHLIGLLEKFLHLCQVLSTLFYLTRVLTQLMLGDFNKTLAEISAVKSQLRDWYKDISHSLPHLINPEEGSPLVKDEGDFSTINLYFNTVIVYYCSAWLVLCHHERLCLVTQCNSAHHPLSVYFTATARNQREIEEATLALTKCFERVSQLGSGQTLPCTVVLCTAIPLTLHALDCQMSTVASLQGSDQELLRQNLSLKCLVRILKDNYSRYDVIDLIISILRHELGTERLEDFYTATNELANDSFQWKSLLSLAPKIYLRLVYSTSLSLSKSRVAKDPDLPPTLRNAVHPRRGTAAAPNLSHGTDWSFDAELGIDVSLAFIPSDILFHSDSV